MSNGWSNIKMSPHNRFKRDISKFSTPTLPTIMDNQKIKASLQPRMAQSAVIGKPHNKCVQNKYGHVQSKVKTFWTQQEIDRRGDCFPEFKDFFQRKGTTLASSSACSYIAASPNTSTGTKTVCLASLRQMQKLSGDDFAARISEIKNGVQGLSSSISNHNNSDAEGKENNNNNK